MNLYLKIIICFIFLHNSWVSAQVDNLSMIEALTEGLPQTDSDQESNVDKRIEESQLSPKAQQKDRDEFKTETYGFNGKNGFRNTAKSKFSEDPLEYFGYSYFRDQPEVFKSLDNAPVPADYLIGPDDSIKIILFGNTSAKYQLTVTREGDIFIPEIGPLSVAGISFEDLKNLIRDTVSSELIGTQASVTLGSLRSINIFILGSANNPGIYNVSALSSLTNALIKSGGVDISGSLRNIKHKRNGETINTFDFYDLLLNGDTSNDSRLMQGDVILIEPIGKTVGIGGEVNRPGIYELIDNENLSDLLRYAGSTKPKADLSSSEITRINSSKKSFDMISMDLSKNQNSNFNLINGDVLSIYPLPNNLQKAILIKGHAIQPGFYAWETGMRIGDLFSSSKDLLEDTDLNYLLIERVNQETQDIEYHQVNLKKLFNLPNSKENIFLNDQDKIILFPKLLSLDSIKTRLINDEYEFDQEMEQYIKENEWQSESQLIKSIDQSEQQEIPITYSDSGQPIQQAPVTEKQYFEYSINDYCFLSSEEIKEFIPSQEPVEPVEPLAAFCRKYLLEEVILSIEASANSKEIGIVSIYGGVHYPGNYPLTESMVLSDIIDAAGGEKDSTYLSEIEVISQVRNDKTYETKTKFTSIKQADALKIRSLDKVTVKKISTKRETVEIQGEVNFPGTYPISENESISDLIRRAGGLTNKANIKGAFFQRQALIDSQLEQLENAKDELRRKVLLAGQTQSLGEASTKLSADEINALTELVSADANKDGLGRLIISLDKILDGGIDDLELEDMDKLTIPKKSSVVSVIGEVYVANSHSYDDQYSIKDYLEFSGGVSEYGDEKAIYVIKADGSIIVGSDLSSGFFRSDSNGVDPGDTIVVPLMVQPFSAIRATTEISQIVYQMAIAAAAVNSF